jgi:hypothetical protein
MAVDETTMGGDNVQVAIEMDRIGVLTIVLLVESVDATTASVEKADVVVVAATGKSGNNSLLPINGSREKGRLFCCYFIIFYFRRRLGCRRCC